MTVMIFKTLPLFILAAVLMTACQTQSPPASGGAEAPAPNTSTQAPPSSPKGTEPVPMSETIPIQPQSGTSQQSFPTPTPPPPRARSVLPSIPKDGGIQSKPLREDGIHDPTGPAIGLLQEPAAALAQLPLDNRGMVNWVEALAQNKISPRADREGKESMTTFDLDLVMTDTKNMPHVRFPHSAHTQWLACENCHPAIFIPQVGANPIDMNAIFKQKYCGACHDKVAFPLVACPRCHSITHENSPPQWW